MFVVRLEGACWSWWVLSKEMLGKEACWLESRTQQVFLRKMVQWLCNCSSTAKLGWFLGFRNVYQVGGSLVMWANSLNDPTGGIREMWWRLFTFILLAGLLHQTKESIVWHHMGWRTSIRINDTVLNTEIMTDWLWTGYPDVLHQQF